MKSESIYFSRGQLKAETLEMIFRRRQQSQDYAFYNGFQIFIHIVPSGNTRADDCDDKRKRKHQYVWYGAQEGTSHCNFKYDINVSAL